MIDRIKKICWTVGSILLLFSSETLLANYAAAQQYFARKDYMSAAAAYFNTYTAPRNKEERIKAEWGLAQSLQKLNLYNSASKYYSIIVRRGPGGGNPFFRSAMEELGRINSRISLGQSHVVKLFKTKINPSDVPGPARGFYFYYLGIEAFNDRKLEKSSEYFEKVPSDSAYHLGAIFHLGVVANLSGQHSKAISYFERVLSGAGDSERNAELREMAIMNIARVHYEVKRYSESIGYYSRIPRDSDYWLDAIWEASWAFFFMEKFNNSLGNIHTIHSPFFINRFYPETYILQAITFLRLCRYDEVKESMRRFKVRYSPVFGDVKAMLNRYRGNPKGFFKLVYDYKSGQDIKYNNAEEIIKKLSYMDAYKGARDTIRFADRELDALNGYGKWKSSGLLGSLKSFLDAKKSSAITDAGRRMYKLSTTYYSQLLDLSNQTKLIVAEMQLGKLAKLRSKIAVTNPDDKVQFIGGMQKLSLSQSLEYWPFEQEYWEDELGYYVYNMNSQCTEKGAAEKKK